MQSDHSQSSNNDEKNGRKGDKETSLDRNSNSYQSNQKLKDTAVEDSVEIKTIETEREEALEIKFNIIACDCDNAEHENAPTEVTLKDKISQQEESILTLRKELEHKESDIEKMKETFANKIQIFHDLLEKRNNEVKRLTSQSSNSLPPSETYTKEGDQSLENVAKNHSPSSNISLDSKKIIEGLNKRVSTLITENKSLKNDIGTLLDFKNELEQLADQQNDQINTLNSTIAQLNSKAHNTEEIIQENKQLNAQIDSMTDTMQFLENENKVKADEIEELNKDIKHLMDLRAEMKKKAFKDEQKIKGLQQVVIKDLKTKLSKKKEEIKILKDMLGSATKQSKILSSENLRLKKKFNDYKERCQHNKSTLVRKLKRENRKGAISHTKKSNRNLQDDHFYGLKGIVGTNEDDNSPKFQESMISKPQNKQKFKSPNAPTLDQIVIINNHEYLGKLHPPLYKKKRNEGRRTPRRSHENEIKNSKSEERLGQRYIHVEDSKERLMKNEQDPRFTFNDRKDSKATDISEKSFKDKYDRVYDTYVGNISSVPGYKNRSSGVKAVMNLNQAQYSFNHPASMESIPKVVSYNQNGSKINSIGLGKTPKLKKIKNLRKYGPNIVRRNDMIKYFTPQKETSKF
ncbi:unnamed protein product [Moneuplotes crassus]|uniref:Uncharacterized protein n=1 Tax=Euplotes crassus TaxID=5936 RepID=A0AAD1Y078_EUPCR|nr:unnamed protein product [Moneuplotes crassus]